MHGELDSTLSRRDILNFLYLVNPLLLLIMEAPFAYRLAGRLPNDRR